MVRKKAKVVKKAKSLVRKLSKGKFARAIASKVVPRKSRTLNITVVDAHHHVLKPIWDEVRRGILPSSGVKLVHFDSHPDMGCIGSELDPDEKEQIDRVKRILPKLYKNSFNEEECLALSDIATWIPSLVFQGLVDEVVWICGPWCNQINVGTHELIVGRSIKDGMMRVATPNNKRGPAFEYWDGDDCLVKCEDLEMQRPWKLHVFPFCKSGEFRADHARRIAEICSSPWILDIDEDYLSCQNPFALEFRQMFGEEAFATLKRVFGGGGLDGEAYNRYYKLLEELAEDEAHLLSASEYASHDLVRAAKKELSSRTQRDKKRWPHLMSDFRSLCRQVVQPDGRALTGTINSHLDVDFVMKAGSLVDLPHHISTLPEMLKILKGTSNLFRSLRNAPGVVTVATSRADEYTPEPQANTIHTMIVGVLKKVWSRRKSLDVHVHRKDFRDGLSVYNGDWRQNLRLFLGQGKKKKKAKFCTPAGGAKKMSLSS
eukprot:TRINITY_DN8507_c0_g1_i1.p1 TRINITY_DN8507_c0_g1~~TRINITY_DN8507_c0_g1_i1.p1  ORF type:complete len:487 (-),score=95.95 TRINITY_DN8507_c0_g1_i1:69-1529(-)